MQNRYVADIGDYGKYGLLRYLGGHNHPRRSIKLGVLWYLVPDERHNNDGAKTHYLFTDSGSLRSCDPDLYEHLKVLVNASERNVSAVKRSGLLPNANFFDRLLHERRLPRALRTEARRRWLVEAVAALGSSDLIFLDPDNGLEAASAPIGSPNSHKYAYLSDVQAFVAGGHSVLIYHHICRRGTARKQVLDSLARLRSVTGKNYSLSAFLYHRGTARAYFLLTSSKHYRMLLESTQAFLESQWSRHFELILPNS